MRQRLLLVSALVAAVAVAATPAAARRKRTPLCQSGLYQVSGTPLLPGDTAPEAIVLSAGKVSIATGCSAVAARLRAGKNATGLVAHWKTCGSTHRVRLNGLITGANCGTFAGVLRRKGARPHDFQAALQLPPGADMTMAFGKATDASPPGAMDVSPDVFLSLTVNGDFHLVSPTLDAADKQHRAADMADNETLIGQLMQGDPTLVDRYSMMPADGDASVQSMDNGNFLLTVTDANRQMHQFETYGQAPMHALLADGIRKFPTRANQLAIYSQYYPFVQANPALFGNLPIVTPDNANNLTLMQITDLNNRIAVLAPDAIAHLTPPGGTPPPGYPASCAAEIGSGDGTDRTGSVCPHASLGLWNTKTWPNKFYATCVKNQGNRGTCGSFGITGALELAAAKAYAQWNNFSEEHLYFLVKGVWSPGPPWYGDGMGTKDVLDRLIMENYAPPYEMDWDYNPSYSRTEDDTTQTYTHSCTGYTSPQASYCSDTNHQGFAVCAILGPYKWCMYAGPGTATGYHFTNAVELWNPSNPSLGVALAVWAAAIFQRALVMGAAVPPSFDHPDANGYVHYVGPPCPVVNNHCQAAPGCECSRGGHIYLVTGFIANGDLPVGAPAASGDGYFIVKNSWGACYADAGYVYLPSDWVQQYGWSLVNYSAM